MMIEPRKRSFLCCFKQKCRKNEPSIFDTQLICDFSEDDNCLQGYKLRFFPLKRGFERKLDFEIIFSSSNVKSFTLEYGTNPNERELLI